MAPTASIDIPEGSLAVNSAMSVPAKEGDHLISHTLVSSSQSSQSSKGRHHSARQFVARNYLLFIAYILGLGITLGCFLFTLYLSRKDIRCPDWAIDCEVDSMVQFMVSNLSEVQGDVSVIYNVGLLLLFFAAYQLGERTTWPMLARQSMTLAELDRYIKATRGGPLAVVQALLSVRSVNAFLTLFCTAVLVVVGLLHSAAVGQAYALVSQDGTYSSIHNAGGGIGLRYTPMDKSPSIPGSVTKAHKLYNAWVDEISDEPLPEFRDYIFDRLDFSRLVNFTIGAVRVQKQISCKGVALEIQHSEVKKQFVVQTSLDKNGGPKANNGSAHVRVQPRTAVWVDSFDYRSKTQTVTKLVFAAINGSIENGVVTALDHMTSVSSVSCDVDVTLVDDQVDAGMAAPGPVVNITALRGDSSVTGPSNHVSPYGAQGDLAGWLGAACTAYGLSVGNTVSMFRPDKRGLGYAEGWESTIDNSTELQDSWSLADVELFIRVASGALGVTLGDSFNHSTTVQSVFAMPRLDPVRSLWLVYPLIPIVIVTGFLMLLVFWSYRSTGIPTSMDATVSSILVNTRGMKMHEEQIHDLKAIEKLTVTYGEVGGGNGYGLLQRC